MITASQRLHRVEWWRVSGRSRSAIVRRSKAWLPALAIAGAMMLMPAAADQPLDNKTLDKVTAGSSSATFAFANPGQGFPATPVGVALSPPVTIAYVEQEEVAGTAPAAFGLPRFTAPPPLRSGNLKGPGLVVSASATGSNSASSSAWSVSSNGQTSGASSATACCAPDAAVSTGAAILGDPTNRSISDTPVINTSPVTVNALDGTVFQTTVVGSGDYALTVPRITRRDITQIAPRLEAQRDAKSIHTWIHTLSISRSTGD